MAQIVTPAGIGKTLPVKLDTTGKTVILTWNKDTYDLATVDFKFQFVSKADGSITPVTATMVTTAPAVKDSNITATITFESNATAKSMENFIAEVQATPLAGNTDTASEWGKERYWIIGPSLTITIGSNSYTLTKDTFAGASTKIYKLPVSNENPLTITYDDIKAFAINMGVSESNIPTTYPDGNPIAASLNIYELVVDLGNALFSLSISIEIPSDNPINNIIPGLGISRLGLALKRTDGSI